MPVPLSPGACAWGQPAGLRLGATREYGPFTVERDRGGLLLRGRSLAWPYRLPLGCFIGAGNLATISPIDAAMADRTDPVERALGHYDPDWYAWGFTDMHRLPPTLATGQLGLWGTHQERTTTS